MKGGKRPLGYTIVEVMIVLAVSGVMFLIAASFINGKQATTAFTSGSTEMGSLLQGVIEDINDGHYSDIPIPCSVSGSGLDLTTGSTQGQGTDANCVFLGKLLHFYTSGTTKPQNYEVLSLADARLDPTQHLPVTTLPNPFVKAIDPLTVRRAIPQNLEVKSVRIVDALGNTHDSSDATPSTIGNGGFNLGFALSLGTADTLTKTTYQTGAQTVGLIYADSTLIGAINGSGQANVPGVNGNGVAPAQSATVCITDGNRYAQIQIGTNDAGNGGNGNQLSVNVQQLGRTPCPY